MSYYLDDAATNTLLAKLRQEYRLYAPKRFPLQGRFSDTDTIRYTEVSTLEEIETQEKSTYSAKEVVSPINQTLFYFTPDEYRETKEASDKPILVFLRPCDIHAFEHQDKIYLENGGLSDSYYARVRSKLRFVLLECPVGFDTCFCVSMGSNQTDHYVMALRREANGMSFQVKDAALEPYFSGATTADFTPQFVTANANKVVLPQIPNKEVLNELKSHPVWDEYDARCTSCGSCTVACATCTCFTTRDLHYTQNEEVGERRRVYSSCQVAGFDEMAGGHIYRPTAASRYRYKMLHKYHDFYARFQETHMCVGCGRCTDHCPSYISVTASIAKMSAAVAEIIAKKGW
ncbi:MAG: anaerobic sulfite reductase subunit AsrA [Symbiobacteriaceae bacterium]|nr:anaerobic sulfite reductase subunit AsrA [Symbiobacteriaceae bacterium]